jgi:cell wall-associated NlpC family hydrolase
MHARTRLRRTALLAVLLLAAASGRAVLGAGQPAGPAADVIKRVQDRFAPDLRLAVFDVKAEPKGGALELSGEVDRVAARDAVLQALRDAGRTNLIDRIVVLPDPQFAARPLGVVTVSVAVMKTKASHESELASQLLMGMVVRVLKKDRWYYVQSVDDRYLGWMEADHLAMMSRQQVDALERAPRLVVTSPFAWVRMQAHADALPVCDLVVGDVLQAAGPGGDFLPVQLPDGRTGYVSRGDVADHAAWTASRAATPDAVEQTARTFMGVPYLWGGTSVKGFDCSGFVQMVFRLNGVALPRDADQQADEGEAVRVDDTLAHLKQGDVLFFGPRPGVTSITHTGIYLGGQLFIHCAGLVKLNSFDPASPLYSDNLLKRLVKARRMSFRPGV